MARRDWGMGGEDALISYDVEGPLGTVVRAILAEKFDGEEGRMAFVHVVPAQTRVLQRSEHPNSSDAEDDLLSQPIAGVSSVEGLGPLPVPGLVFREVRIEKEEGDRSPRSADNVELPSLDLDRTSFDRHLHTVG